MKRRLLVLASLPTATLKAAFGTISKAVHPDKNSCKGAHEAMQKVNAAWQQLRDQSTRAKLNDALISKAVQLAKEHASKFRKQAQQAKRQRQKGPQRTDKNAAKPVKKDPINKGKQHTGTEKQNKSASEPAGASSTGESQPAGSAASKKVHPLFSLKPTKNTDSNKPKDAASSSKGNSTNNSADNSKPTNAASGSKDNSTDSSKPTDAASSHTNSKTTFAASSGSKPEEQPPFKKAKTAKTGTTQQPSKGSAVQQSSQKKASVGFFEIRECKTFVTAKAPVSENTRKFNVTDWHSKDVTYKVAEHFMRDATNVMHKFDLASKKTGKIEVLEKYGVKLEKPTITMSAMREILEQARYSKIHVSENFVENHCTSSFGSCTKKLYLKLLWVDSIIALRFILQFKTIIRDREIVETEWEDSIFGCSQALALFLAASKKLMKQDSETSIPPVSCRIRIFYL